MTASALGDDDVAIAVEAVVDSPWGAAYVGTVADAGERAATLRGKRVLVGSIDPCGECEVCRRGGAAVCPLARRRERAGAQVIAAGRWVVALGDGLDLPVPAAAAVAGDVALAYTLYARTGLAPRDPVVLVGVSPVTRFLVDIVRAKGITPTVVVDADDPQIAAWVDWLLGRGCALARIAADADDDAARATVTAAVAAQGTGVKPWRVIATTAGATARAAALAGPRATLTLLAPATGVPSATFAGLVAREVIVIGVAGAHPDLVVEVAAMCVKGEIDLAGGTTTASGDPTRSYVIAQR